MVKRPRINSALLANQILLILHYEFAHTDQHYVYPLSIFETHIPGFSNNALSLALDELLPYDLVERTVSSGQPCLKILPDGIARVESWSDEGYESIADTLNLEGLEGGKEPASDPAELGDTPTSDDTWEPLPLERSGAEYELALEQTETAYSEISGNNGYAQTEPDERERIVWSLSEAVRQMREGMPSRDQILVMAVRPLKYIAEKFAGASMGEAAKAAVKAIWAWLGGG